MSEKVYFADEEIDLEGFIEDEVTESINPMLHTLGIIGDKWNILILSLLLSKGDQSFIQIAEFFPNLTEPALKSKLEKLEVGQTIEEKQVGDQVVYTLTDTGLKLKPLLSEMKDWGRKASVKAGKGTSVKMGSGKAVKDSRGKIKIR